MINHDVINHDRNGSDINNDSQLLELVNVSDCDFIKKNISLVLLHNE